MVFVNEKLTSQLKIEFMKRKIKKPVSDNLTSPLYRTVDKEKNMCLYHLGCLGRDDFDHHMFLFDCDGDEHFIIMKYSDPDPSTDRIQWSLSKFENNFNGQEDFSDDFKQALFTYAVNGSDKQQGKVIVEVDFKRE